jgi:hypothetical protein
MGSKLRALRLLRRTCLPQKLTALSLGDNDIGAAGALASSATPGSAHLEILEPERE